LRDMFRNIDKEGLVATEALVGEIMENEMTEVVKVMSARRHSCVGISVLATWGSLGIDDILILVYDRTNSGLRDQTVNRLLAPSSTLR
jgi:hypothetical protein